MGNANGKFDATTVALYNRLDLIQQRTYESKKTAAKVMTNRSAKALHLVKSGFDKKFRHWSDTSSDELSGASKTVSNHLPNTDVPLTPARTNRTSTRLQFTPRDNSPKIATPSPDKQGCEAPPDPLEAYKSVTTQPLRRMLPHEIVGLSDSDLITLVVSTDTHKFNLIRDRVGSDNLSKHSFIRETKTMYEFPALLKHFQDRDGIQNGIFSDSELKRKFGSQGDGFTVSLAIYGLKFGVRFKDILNGSVELYQTPSPDYEHPDFFDIAGRSRDPSKFASYYGTLLDMTHGDQSQTMRVLVSYYRQNIESLQKDIGETNTKLRKTELDLKDATQSFLTAEIISAAS
jgi:hypothetical protein